MNFILHFFLILGSYVTPKNKNLLLFGGGYQDEFMGHPKYLFLHLLRNNPHSFQFAWITGSKKVVEKLQAKNLPVIYKYSWKGFTQLLKANWFFHEKSAKDIYYSHRIAGRFNFFQTWHGTPLKMIGQDGLRYAKKGWQYKLISSPLHYKFAKAFGILSMRKYKAVLAPSKEVGDILHKAFDNPNIKLFGYPRVDALFNSALTFQNHRDDLRLDRYSNVALYAPTFRDNLKSVSPFSKEELEKVNEFFRRNNQLLLVKKHPLDTQLEIAEHLSNIVDVSNKVDDIQEILLETDVLITDYSSVFFDFMVTKKPIVFYAYDLENYLENCRDMYFDYEEVAPGPIARDADALIELLKTQETWSEDSSYRNKYDALNERFNKFNDGKACERLLDFIASA